MECWIFVHIPLQNWDERWISNYQRIFDAWEDGGVRGIVVGRLRLKQEDGSEIRPYAADPKVYRAFGVDPPEAECRNPEQERVFRDILDNAAARGWHIMTFDAPGGGALPPEEDPYGVARFAAAAQDLARALPQVQGVIVDGPGEQHYELAWHHGRELFEMGIKDQFAARGFDVDRLARGIAHLRQRFHELTPDLVRYHATGGMLAGLNLFDIDEDALYWLRSRQEQSLQSWQQARADLDKVDRYVELGAIPRITTFSSLTGHDYQQMPPYFDYIFPKHYYWHRGFDGMYGTIQRWVLKFTEWNPSLTEEDGFQLIKSLFGLELPGVNTLIDLEMGFPEEFFTETVYNETRRALDAIKDVDKTIFWVSTGRFPHAGDPMTARDLDGILKATQAAGGERFLFHPDPNPGPSEWTVITNMCGNPWHQSRDGYWPPDANKPDEYNRDPT